MSKIFSNPRGTADIQSSETFLWRELEKKAHFILNLFNYKEIRTPIFEEGELFARSMGQTSDVVQKQMLNLQPQGQSSDDKERALLALRPEGTASVVRSYIQNSLDKKENLSKLYYIGPMFRGERPQKGRLRQFHQIGVEAIGPQSASPYLDAEVIALSANLLKSLGIKDFNLKINTLGSTEDKENFSKYLRQELKKDLSLLCPDCQNRFERNVFRILDCKNKQCKETVAKVVINDQYLSAESRQYFSQVKKILDDLGIAYEVSPTLVRGLDYYTHTVFEISSSALGSQDALGAGGRYNNLIEQLGGPKVDGIGFALGIERILLALGAAQTQQPGPDVFLMALDEKSLEKTFVLGNRLRSELALLEKNTNKTFIIENSYKAAPIKKQMTLANKIGASYVIILGENELNKGILLFKDMSSGQQDEIKINDVQLIVKRLLGERG